MEARRIALCMILVALGSMAGCAPEATRPMAVQGIQAAESGPTVLEHLRKRYDEEFDDCGSPTRPAFLCSGIMMRSTEYSPQYHSWLPNPATAGWGVSFSWLREDSNFPDNYPTGNGFIVYPWFYSDDGNYQQLKIRCIYPRDGWTGAPDRCRTICQNLKPSVTTAKEWLDRGFNYRENQCAFGVDDSRNDSAFAWTQVKKIRYEKRIFYHNEIIIDAWPQNVGARMPVEAFFYRDNCMVDDDDDCKGDNNPPDFVQKRLENARADQRDFKNTTGRWVPIIRWTPAKSFTSNASFDYRAPDQAIAGP